MIALTRPIKFEDVDAVVFFARYVTYAHEAMEHFFSAVDGGYPRLIENGAPDRPAGGAPRRLLPSPGALRRHAADRDHRGSGGATAARCCATG